MIDCSRLRRGLAKYGLPLTLVACGADSSAESSPMNGGNADGGTAPVDAGSDSAIDTAPPPPPPEKEVEGSYRSPVATGKYVWIANPKSGRVAYIDAATLDVRVVEAGNGPTYMAAVPSPAGDDVAVVLNVLSDDATMLRRTSLGLVARGFKTHHGANAWKVSADGRWAIAWTDASGVSGAHKTEGFQDLTVIDLTEKVPPTVLAVGYRPVSVGFTKAALDASPRAYAVTQDGISLIELGDAGPLVTHNVSISAKPLEDPGTRDVSLTPDGRYALIRRDGDADVTIVSLETGSRTAVTLSGPVTDLDLTEDGRQAIAVVREHSEVAILPIPLVATDPKAFTTVTVAGEKIGSVSIAENGTSAVLYTNAFATERFTVLALDEAPPTFRVTRLYAPVLAVFPTADAKNAIVVHDKPASDPTARPAFSVVPIAAGLPAKIVGTDAPIGAVALAPAGDRAFVTERDDVRKIFAM